MARMVYSIVSSAYVEQEEIAKNILAFAKKLKSVEIYDNHLNSNPDEYYLIDIIQEDDRLEQYTYSDQIDAFMNIYMYNRQTYETKNGRYEVPGLDPDKVFKTNVLLGMEDCDYLLGQFMKLFIEVYPDMRLCGDVVLKGTGKIEMVTFGPEHAIAGKALGRDIWPWQDPYKLMDDYNAMFPPVV